MTAFFGSSILFIVIIGAIVLANAIRIVRAIAGGHSPTIDQSVLADFIGEGHYMRHVRRVRALCAAGTGCTVSLAKLHMDDRLLV